MLFSRLAATFLFFLTFGVFALATPVALKPEDSIQDVLRDLETSIAPILAAINRVADMRMTSSSKPRDGVEELQALIAQLTAGVSSAKDTLAALAPSTMTKHADETTELLNSFLTDLITTVGRVADVDGVSALLPDMIESLLMENFKASLEALKNILGRS